MRVVHPRKNSKKNKTRGIIQINMMEIEIHSQKGEMKTGIGVKINSNGDIN